MLRSMGSAKHALLSLLAFQGAISSVRLFSYYYYDYYAIFFMFKRLTRHLIPVSYPLMRSSQLLSAVLNGELSYNFLFNQFIPNQHFETMATSRIETNRHL